MKIFKILFFTIFIGIIGFSVFIALKDGNYELSSSKNINAPAEVVFSEITDFKNWQDWDPILASDDTVRTFFPEKTKGVGGLFSWMAEDGNGTIETISIEENKSINQKLSYKNTSPTEIYWNIEALEQGVEVTCEMSGKRSFTEKVLGFITGKTNIKHASLHTNRLELLQQHLQEQLIKHSFKFQGVVDHGGGYYLYKNVSSNADKVSEKVMEKLSLINEFMMNKEIYSAGKPFRMTEKPNSTSGKNDFLVCVPVSENVETNGAMAVSYMQPGKMLKTIFKGDYQFISKAWEATFEELSNTNFQQDVKKKAFEVYFVGPNETKDPSKWVTGIYVPLSESKSFRKKDVEIPLFNKESFQEGL